MNTQGRLCEMCQEGYDRMSPITFMPCDICATNYFDVGNGTCARKFVIFCCYSSSYKYSYSQLVILIQEKITGLQRSNVYLCQVPFLESFAAKHFTISTFGGEMNALPYVSIITFVSTSRARFLRVLFCVNR